MADESILLFVGFHLSCKSLFYSLLSALCWRVCKTIYCSWYGLSIKFSLILLGGDIEKNPGPSRFPCSVCDKPVAKNHRALTCDLCEAWTHIKCGRIAGKTYEKYVQCVENNFVCPKCLFSELPHDMSGSNSIEIVTAQSGGAEPSTLEACETNLAVGEGLSFYGVNVQSLFPKLDEVKSFISGHRPTIMAIMETWLSDSIPDSALEIENYKIFRKDRTAGRGGGVLFYINDCCVFSSIDIPLDYGLEALCFELKPTIGSHVVFCLVYRPPDSVEFIKSINQLLDHLLPLWKPTVIIGDFNVDLKKFSSLGNRYFNIMTSAQFTQLVEGPTRITETSSSTIDHCWTNDQLICNNIDLIEGFGDHMMLRGRLLLKINKKVKEKIKARSFKSFNSEAYIYDLKKYPWHDLVWADDINCQINLFNKFITDCLDKHAPYQQISRSRRFKRPPWITQELVVLINQKKMAFLRALDRGGSLWSDYKKTKNKLNHLIRVSKKNYYHDLFNKNRNNPRAIWRYLRELMGGNIKKNSDLSISPDQLNGYFAGVGEQIYDATRPSKAELLSDDHQQTYVNTSFNDDDTNDFRFKLVNVDSVRKMVSELSDKVAIGVDGVGSRILKLSMPVVEDFLTLILNRSLLMNRVPRIWKTGVVTPIFKDGESGLPSNYRPITVLPTASKILEKIVANQLSEFLENNNLIIAEQSAFRKNHSVATLLVKLVDEWSQNIDSGDLTAVVTLDIRRAFDCISPQILLSKLSNMGFGLDCLLWVTDYLADRFQATKLNGTLSAFVPVKFGVPQGSILGPLLFKIFINDLPKVLEYGHAALFADDTTLYFAHKDLALLKCSLEHDVKRIYNWMALNRMQINDSKTKFMVIGTRNKKKVLQSNELCLEINKQTIPQSHYLKILGVYVDEYLGWDVHIDHLYNKCMKSLFFIMKLRKCLQINSLLLLYNALIVSRLDYCSIVYNSCNGGLANRLQKIQNLAARCFVYGPGRSSASSAISKLNWTRLSDRRKLFILTLMWKISKGQSPNYLIDLFTRTDAVHGCHISPTAVR